MKFRYIGDDAEIVVRDVTFPKGETVDLTECPSLARKVSVLPYFEQVKRGRKANDEKQP